MPSWGHKVKQQIIEGAKRGQPTRTNSETMREMFPYHDPYIAPLVYAFTPPEQRRGSIVDPPSPTKQLEDFCRENKLTYHHDPKSDTHWFTPCRNSQSS